MDRTQRGLIDEHELTDLWSLRTQRKEARALRRTARAREVRQVVDTFRLLTNLLDAGPEANSIDLFAGFDCYKLVSQKLRGLTSLNLLIIKNAGRQIGQLAIAADRLLETRIKTARRAHRQAMDDKRFAEVRAGRRNGR